MDMAVGLFHDLAIRRGDNNNDVRIYVMQGKKDQALRALQEAVAAGWRVDWRMHLKYSPELAALHDDPQYKAMIADLEADMAAQLEHVREMQAAGELAPIPD